MTPRSTPAVASGEKRAREKDGAALLAWYDRHARILPWRARAPARPDPYRVWLAEIMLQQTTVATVGPYYQAFLARWPDVAALASAPLDDVLTAWAGLGYYARARNLHRCARVVAETMGGSFPESEEELRALPGIGRYTAAAIAAIAFDQHAVVVDGNVERVMARMFAIDTAMPKAKPLYYQAAARLTPRRRAGDYAQAVMDLGATICTPRQPRCMLCPWQTRCAARRRGEPERFPVKAAKRARQQRHGVAFVLTRADGAVWLRRRPESGLLGGMMEVPSTAWLTRTPREAEIRSAAPMTIAWTVVPGRVSHGFTHFDLELEVWSGRAVGSAPGDHEGVWVARDQLQAVALPTLMRKALAHGLQQSLVAPRQTRHKKQSRPKRN